MVEILGIKNLERVALVEITEALPGVEDGPSIYEQIKRREQFPTPPILETESAQKNAPTATRSGKITSHHAG